MSKELFQVPSAAKPQGATVGKKLTFPLAWLTPEILSSWFRHELCQSFLDRATPLKIAMEESILSGSS